MPFTLCWVGDELAHVRDPGCAVGDADDGSGLAFRRQPGILRLSPSPKQLTLFPLNSVAEYPPPQVRTLSAEREDVCWSSSGLLPVSRRVPLPPRQRTGRQPPSKVPALRSLLLRRRANPTNRARRLRPRPPRRAPPSPPQPIRATCPAPLRGRASAGGVGAAGSSNRPRRPCHSRR